MKVLNKFNIHQKNLPMIYRNERQTINMPIGRDAYTARIKPLDLAPVTNFSEAW